jgi:hypothetical protein
MNEPGFFSLVPKEELGNQINRIISGLALGIYVFSASHVVMVKA